MPGHQDYVESEDVPDPEPTLDDEDGGEQK